MWPVEVASSWRPLEACTSSPAVETFWVSDATKFVLDPVAAMCVISSGNLPTAEAVMAQGWIRLTVARAAHAVRGVARAWVRAEAVASEVVTGALFPELRAPEASTRSTRERDSAEATAA
jgi:hypothetical protein